MNIPLGFSKQGTLGNVARPEKYDRQLVEFRWGFGRRENGNDRASGRSDGPANKLGAAALRAILDMLTRAARYDKKRKRVKPESLTQSTLPAATSLLRYPFCWQGGAAV